MGMMREAFLKASAKPEGSSGIDFLEAILRERPDLREQRAYFPKQGWNAHTVFIGDEVFKGPRQEMHVAGFDNEYQTLQQMTGKGLPVPEVTCVGKDAVFFGMKRLEGVILPDNFTEIFTQEEQRALAKDIIAFVVGMSQEFPLQDDKFMGHRDFNPGNILIDPETKKLSAIIDFGYAGYIDRKNCHCFQGAFLDAKERLAGFNEMLDEEYRRVKPSVSGKPVPSKVPGL
jgi:aminoglycoside phosphotransferase (APT) family kinase protein